MSRYHWITAWLFAVVLSTNFLVESKIHHLRIQDDSRTSIELTHFGYALQGTLDVTISNLTASYQNDDTSKHTTTALEAIANSSIGFSFSKGDEIPEFVRTTPGDCLLSKRNERRGSGLFGVPAVYFLLDLRSKTLKIERHGSDLINLEVCRTSNCVNTKKLVAKEQNKEFRKNMKPLAAGRMRRKWGVRIFEPQEEGQYYLIYHNCYNYNCDFDKRILISFTIEIKEKNVNSYLGAGDTPRPALYFGMAALFFATAIVWVHIVKGTKQNQVYRIHHLMTALVFIKSKSLLFHGVDFYFISLYGRQQEVWAIVFYIMHLLKGALLFGVIILIGTGYTFFKNFLTGRDRNLFMIIIPLQVLDNVAMVIIEESEEGTLNYRFWMQLFIFIDLICCLAIILPVIWSIRHLQEASQTDGKAAFNLGKLRLFRHFYILIICYVYLTRIIKYLVVVKGFSINYVKFTVPFKHTWLVVIVEEVGTWLFFVITGYKFKPAPNNPYLKLSQSDDELEMEEAITQSGVLEGVTRLKRGPNAFDTSLGSPEGEELLGEDVVYSKDVYERSTGATNAPKTADGSPGPDIY